MTYLSERTRGASEGDEIRRSAAEARRRDNEALIITETQRRRYVSPSARAHYSLEYAFYLLPDLAGKEVLDFGCGAGENAVCLALRGAKVTGLDISAELVALANRRVAANGVRANFVVASATDIALPNAYFDVVFGAAILHHLDAGLAGREALRILKPGGCAVFSEPVRVSRLARLSRRLIPAKSDEISPGEYPLSPSDIQEFSKGMELVACKAFELPHLKLMDGGLARSIDRRVLDRCTWLSRFASIRVWKCVKPMRPA